MTVLLHALEALTQNNGNTGAEASVQTRSWSGKKPYTAIALMSSVDVNFLPYQEARRM